MMPSRLLVATPQRQGQTKPGAGLTCLGFHTWDLDADEALPNLAPVGRLLLPVMVASQYRLSSYPPPPHTFGPTTATRQRLAALPVRDGLVVHSSCAIHSTATKCP